jgi:hypothetical protein
VRGTGDRFINMGKVSSLKLAFRVEIGPRPINTRTLFDLKFNCICFKFVNLTSLIIL